MFMLFVLAALLAWLAIALLVWLYVFHFWLLVAILAVFAVDHWLKGGGNLRRPWQ